MSISTITGKTVKYICETLLYGHDLPELYTATSTNTSEITAARDGFDSLTLKNADQDTKILAASSGSGVLVSADDIGGIGYLNTKILAGDGIEFNINNPAGAETATIKHGALAVNDIGTVIANTVIDLNNGLVQKITVNADITISFANFPATGSHYTVMLILTDTGDRAITWDTPVKWAYGLEPVIVANSRNRFLFCSEDGGTTIDGGFIGGGFA